MTTAVERIRDRAKANQRRIVFPETRDPRVVEAVNQFASDKLGVPVVIATGDSTNDFSDGVAVFDTNSNQALLDQCAGQLFQNRKHRGLSLEAAKGAIGDPLLLAALLVKVGFVDGSVAGSIATTASVIRAGLYGIGTPADQKLVSSFFLMQMPDQCLTYADCGVVPDPSADELAEIAICSAASHQILTGETPKVAMLSFSSKGSADHPRVSKVREALAIVKTKQPDLCIDGELQFDAAFVPEIAKRKAPDSDVAGNANTFIFPDLDSGNIAYKITERLAGAKALGPLIQGLARPFMDLSRGCKVSDIVDVACVASVMASE